MSEQATLAWLGTALLGAKNNDGGVRGRKTRFLQAQNVHGKQ